MILIASPPQGLLGALKALGVKYCRLAMSLRVHSESALFARALMIQVWFTVRHGHRASSNRACDELDTFARLHPCTITWCVLVTECLARGQWLCVPTRQSEALT